MSARSAAHTALVRIASVFTTDVMVLGFGLVNTVLATRILGPSGRGVVVLATNTAMMVQTFATLGLPWAINYEAARSRTDRDLRRHVTWLMVRNIPLAIGIWAIAYALVAALRHTAALGNMAMPILALSASFSMLVLLRQLGTRYLGGLHDFKSRNAVSILGPGLVALCLIANLIVRVRLTPEFVLWLNVAGGVLAVTYAVVLLNRSHGVFPARYSANGTSNRDFRIYGAKFSAGLIAQVLNYRLDAFIVNAMMGVRHVGIYATSVSVSELLLLVPTAVNVVMYPTITAIRGDHRNRVTLLATGATMYGVGLLGIVWALLADPIIRVLFGSAFTESAGPARWLIPGMLAIGIVRVLCHAAAGAGHPEVLTYTTFAGLAFTIPLDLVLIPRIGVLGAALASTIAYSVSALMAVYLYGKVTDQNSLRVWSHLFRDPLVRAIRAVGARRYPGRPPGSEGETTG